MTNKKQSTSLTSPTKGNSSQQGKNSTLAKSTTSPPLSDRAFLSPIILILLRSWLHWINLQSCRRPFHCRPTKRGIFLPTETCLADASRESGDRMSLDSVDSRPSKFQYLILTDGLIWVTARQLGVQAPTRCSMAFVAARAGGPSGFESAYQLEQSPKLYDRQGW